MLTTTKLPAARNRTAFVVEQDGKPVGYLWQGKNTRTTTFPWQVKVYTGTMQDGAGQTCYTGELVTSVYPDGKGVTASLVARKACLEALTAAL